MSHTTKATNATYLNTSRENMLEWKRAFDTTCDKHPERLLSVVTNNKLHSSILLKYMTQYKQLKMTFEDDHDEILAEAQRSAYLILIDTIGDRQTLQTIERKFVNNASGAYNYILKMWEAKATDDRAVALDNKRADHIRQGAKSSSKRHMTEFVECLLQYNIELEGTAFEMMNETVVLHVLTALQKHNKALVTSYKAANAGKDDWNSDFDKVWDQLQLLLESDDLAEDANNDPTSADILKTNIIEDPRDALLRQLTEQVKTLTMAVQAVQGNMNEGKSILRTRAVQPQLASCMDCGYPHPRRGEHPCVGKALATGEINMEEAKLLFHNLNNPENAAINAKERYLAYQEKLKPTTPTSPKVIIPTKKVVLTTQVAQVHVPAQECDNMNTYTKLKVDTCADITILNDPRFFKHGVDTKDTHTLETYPGTWDHALQELGRLTSQHAMEQRYASSRRTSALQHVRTSSPHATSRATPSLIFNKDTCACSRMTSSSHSTPGMRPSSFVQPLTWSFHKNMDLHLKSRIPRTTRDHHGNLSRTRRTRRCTSTRTPT